jgi:hypothetical protein
MANVWLIGVMVELEDERVPQRHFFAVGVEDRAKAEWRAIDRAMLTGRVASSPVGGLEPVHAIAELTGKAAAGLALAPGEVKALGRRWPRRLVTYDPGTPSRP